MSDLLRLETDFRDDYDHRFNPQGPIIFRRRTNDGPTRRMMFGLFSAVGLAAPWHGSIQEACRVAGSLSSHRFVVHSRPDAAEHRGEGKELVSVLRLRDAEPAAVSGGFAVEHIDTRPDSGGWQSEAWRLLLVGTRSFWFRYRSWTDWRTNCGDGQTDLLLPDLEPRVVSDLEKASRDLQVLLQRPLLAMDFVQPRDSGSLLAIDLNVSPALTRIRDQMTPQEIYREIEAFVAGHKYL